MNSSSQSFIIKKDQFALINNNTFVANISHSLSPSYVLVLYCYIYDFGIVHCSIEDTKSDKSPRFKASKFGPLVIDSNSNKSNLILKSNSEKILITTKRRSNDTSLLGLHGKSHKLPLTLYSLEIYFDPFRIIYLENHKVKMIVNENQFLNYEIYRTIEEH